MKIPLREHFIYSEKLGTGTPIVLVNGGPGCTYMVFKPIFQKHVDFASFVFFDPIGVGKSSRPNQCSHRLNDLLEQIEAIRIAFCLEKFFIMGHSFGGIIAQLYSLKYEQHLNGMILVCATPGMPHCDKRKSKLDLGLTPNEEMRIQEIRRLEISDIERQELIFENGGWKRYFRSKPNRDYLRARSLEWDNDQSFVTGMSEEAKSIDLEGEFADCRIPTLVIESTHDNCWIDEKRKKMRENHPNAIYVEFDRSGHSPFLEQEQEFFEVVEQFIGQNGNTRRNFA